MNLIHKERKYFLSGGLFFGVLIAVTYFNSLSNGFVADDVFAIPAQGTFLGSFNYVFSNPAFFARSVLFFTAYHLGGINPWIFRMINIFFHFGSVFLFFTILFYQTRKKKLAFFAASLFAVHPLLSESVAWISGGIYAQYTFFYFLAWFMYAQKNRSRYAYFLSLFSFILALSTSEKAVTFLLFLPFYELLFGNLLKNWKKIIPYFLVIPVWVFFMFPHISERLSNSTLSTGPIILGNPFVIIPAAIYTYVRLFIWPNDLTFYHVQKVFTIYYL